eukprot:gene912-217_t
MVKTSKSGRIDPSYANAVVKAIDLNRKKNKGQHLDNIAEIFAADYKWSSNETIQALKLATAQNLIKEVSYSHKISYRVIKSTIDLTSKNSNVEPASESKSITDTLKLGEHSTTDFEDFKQFIHGEVLDLKSQLATCFPSAPSAAPVIDYEQAFIRSLEHRILSLEKQLDDKQSIINKLLAERTSSKFNALGLGLGLQDNHSTVAKNNGAHSIQSNETKPSETRNEGINHLPEQQRSAANVSTTSSNTVKQNKLTNKLGEKKKQESSMENGNNEQETAQPEKNTGKRVFIIGDSILNGISEYGLNKSHDVIVHPHSGATSQDIKDHIKPIIRRKPDLIIIHAGTNDLTQECNTVEEMNEIFDAVRSDPPRLKL